MAKPRLVKKKRGAVEDDEPGVVRSENKLDQLRVYVNEMNKKMKGIGRIDVGADIKYIDPPRRNSGILTLDVLMNGGLPRGGMVQYWGPYSTAKTTTLLHNMSTAQLRGELTFFGAAEGLSKDWARQNGLWIPYAPEEYTNVNEETHMTEEERTALIEGMQAYDQYGIDNDLAPVTVAQHIHGDGLLEQVARAVKSNIFSIVGVDSLGAIRNSRQLEEKEVGDEEMGGGGVNQLLGRFFGRCYSALNTRYEKSGKFNIDGEFANETTLICLNQARVDIGAKSMTPGGKLKPFAGEATKHAWQLSIEFSKGEEIGTQQGIDGKQVWIPYGQEIRVKCDKSKIGPWRRSGNWELYTEANDYFAPGSINHAKMARQWAIYYDIIGQSGAWYTMPDGERVNGKDALDLRLKEDAALIASLEDTVRAVCRRKNI